MNETELTLALSRKFCAPEYAFLSQVRNQTGFRRRVRTADALAISCYPSRGIYLYGFEIKVDRYDWLNEMKNPEKAEEIGRNCHFWMVVAPAEGVVKRSELPAKWGLLLYNGKDLRQAKPPILISDHKVLPVEFVAAMMRKAADSMVPAKSVDAVVEERVKTELEDDIKRRNRERDFCKEQLEGMTKAVEEFQEASGVQINQWSAGNIGKAVNKVLSMYRNMDGLNSLRAAVGSLSRLHSDSSKYLTELESIFGKGKEDEEEQTEQG